MIRWVSVYIHEIFTTHSQKVWWLFVTRFFFSEILLSVLTTRHQVSISTLLFVIDSEAVDESLSLTSSNDVRDRYDIPTRTWLDEHNFGISVSSCIAFHKSSELIAGFEKGVRYLILKKEKKEKRRDRSQNRPFFWEEEGTDLKFAFTWWLINIPKQDREYFLWRVSSEFQQSHERDLWTEI